MSLILSAIVYSTLFGYSVDFGRESHFFISVASGMGPDENCSPRTTICVCIKTDVLMVWEIIGSMNICPMMDIFPNLSYDSCNRNDVSTKKKHEFPHSVYK